MVDGNKSNSSPRFTNIRSNLPDDVQFRTHLVLLYFFNPTSLVESDYEICRNVNSDLSALEAYNQISVSDIFRMPRCRMEHVRITQTSLCTAFNHVRYFGAAGRS